MEVFALLGFIFGLSGIAFGFIATNQVIELRKEVQQLKDQLENGK